MKKHNRRKIGEWESKDIDTFWIYLYVGGSYQVAEKACRKACFPSGLCVTIEEVKYVFGGGSEGGVRVGFLNYPPFPSDIKHITEKAIKLGKSIVGNNYQFSFTIVTPEKTTFYSRVK